MTRIRPPLVGGPGRMAGRFRQATLHDLEYVFVPLPWLEIVRNRFCELDHDAKYGPINRGGRSTTIRLTYQSPGAVSLQTGTSAVGSNEPSFFVGRSMTMPVVWLTNLTSSRPT